jgi:hypothetical protein
VGAPTLLVIDETGALGELDETPNRAIIVQNIPGAPAVDVYFEDTRVIENLTFGNYGVAAAPDGVFKAYAKAAGTDEVLF